jgi:hypothetical protein
MLRALSLSDCLALWEVGRALHPLDRGLLAIQAASVDSSVDSADGDRDDVADWPLGRRNRALAELRCACFGSRIEGWTACEGCGEKLAFQVDGNTLIAAAPPASDVRVESHGRVFRLPTTRDLARIATEKDAARAASLLLDRCAVADAGATEPPRWTDEEIEAIGETLAAADPLAEILLHFDCPTCAASFDRSLDLTAFLWSEIEGRAKRLLREVHTLASAYGWTEAEILSLSAARRDFYLEMVRA